MSNSNNLAILNQDVLNFLDNINAGNDTDMSSTVNRTAYSLARGGISRTLSQFLIEKIIEKPLNSELAKEFKVGYSEGVKKGYFKALVTAGTGRGMTNDERVYNFLSNALANRFFLTQDEQGNKSVILEHLDGDIVRVTSKDKVIQVIAEVIRMELGEFLNHTKLKLHTENFLCHYPALDYYPKSVVFQDDPALAFHRLDFSPKAGSSPLFDEFIGRCSNGKALMAFIWSLFIGSSDRQQYVWIKGDGGDGKSSLASFLAKLLGNSYTAERAAGSFENRFYTYGFIGKRLAVYSDTNCSGFVKSGLFKELSGGDYIKVEPKGEKAYTVKIDCKFMFLSNTLPEISTQKADQRRIILVEVKPIKVKPDPLYDSKLWAERAAILFKCKEAYDELTQQNSVIKCDLMDAEALGFEQEVPYELAIRNTMVITKDPADQIEALDFHELIRPELGERKVKGFLSYLKRKYGIVKKGKPGAYYYQGIIKRKGF